jgi:hypothetical protein
MKAFSVSVTMKAVWEREPTVTVPREEAWMALLEIDSEVCRNRRSPARWNEESLMEVAAMVPELPVMIHWVFEMAPAMEARTRAGWPLRRALPLMVRLPVKSPVMARSDLVARSPVVAREVMLPAMMLPLS